MSVNKYANLPDIDTAPDIYETEDTTQDATYTTTTRDPTTTEYDLDDDELLALNASRHGRHYHRQRNAPYGNQGQLPDGANDGLDKTGLMSTEDATRRFRKAEKEKTRMKMKMKYVYTTLEDDDESESSGESGSSGEENERAEGDSAEGVKKKVKESRKKGKTISLTQRLNQLQKELELLETELSDPANPKLTSATTPQDKEPGELIRGVVDIRSRLNRIRKGREGRGRLVGVLLGNGTNGVSEAFVNTSEEKIEEGKDVRRGKEEETRNLVEMDRRVGHLEKMIGANTASLDEVTPLPPPLLPQIQRLQSQILILSQPRHIDSISRRLKLLLTDLERVQKQQSHSQHSPTGPGGSSLNSQQVAQIVPLLTKLSPSLPQIPHILTRLRTLSQLHLSASSFVQSIQSLEEEQLKIKQTLDELKSAVDGIEKVADENVGIVKKNVEGLENRLGLVESRLEGMEAQSKVGLL